MRRLDDDDRVAELARMLAGLGESDSGRAHARELLERRTGRPRDRSPERVADVTEDNF